MNDYAVMTGKPEVIRFEMGTGFISTKIVVETRAIRSKLLPGGF